jgi:hypothetical protein
LVRDRYRYFELEVELEVELLGPGAMTKIDLLLSGHDGGLNKDKKLVGQ